ncbi:30S ribosomal protein S2 [Patescibacteria group bacterium]
MLTQKEKDAHPPTLKNGNVNPEIEEMFKAGLHFAYKKTRRHPKMIDFIVGVKSNVEIFNLELVYKKLQDALTFVESLGASNKVILWVGSKPAASAKIKEVALGFSHSFVDQRWVGGALTNFKVIRSRVDYLEDLEEKLKSGELGGYTKQERLKLSEKAKKLGDIFDGLRLLKKMPDALFVVDLNEEITAVKEARILGIPVVAILNSDGDPSFVDYPIPANDNSSQSVGYILDKVVGAYKRGVKKQ